MLAKRLNWVIRPLLILAGLWFALDLAAYLGAESLWFRSVNYFSVFRLQLQTRLGLWLVAGGGTAIFFGTNVAIAHRLKYYKVEERGRRGIRLPLLLSIAVGLSLVMGLLLIYYAQVASHFWHPSTAVITGSSQVFNQLELYSFWQILLGLGQPVWQSVLLLGLMLVLILYPEPLLWLIGAGISLGFGLILSSHWATVLKFGAASAFGQTEPVFGQDIGFYVFRLPLWELLRFWWVGFSLVTILAVTLLYLLSGNSLSQGRFPGFSRPQQRHLYGLGAFLVGAIAFSYGLSRYELLYSTQGVSYGASYTDVMVELPLKTALSLLGLGMAVSLAWFAIADPQVQRRTHFQPTKILLLLSLAIYLTFGLAAESLIPALVQRFVVQPNELIRERPYIQRSIAFTRQGFDLEAIEAETFNPTGSLTTEQLEANELTIRNIRLWDTRPLLASNRQLQQIRLYYRFPDADIDRYTLRTDPSESTRGETERRQVFIAPRELDYTAVPEQAQTWINRRLIYTHGYGFTISPVNTAGAGGLPEYFIRGIGSGGREGGLRTSSEAVAESIPTDTPRIYFGELTQNYVMTSTRVEELDYPSGDDNVYNRYDGRGGIALNTPWRRWLFAKYLNDWRMLFTENFTSQTELLYRRQVQERVQAIAPFLRFDSDPYLVAADADPDDPTDQSYLYWIIDAYTTSDRYPYSDPESQPFNYIRNSVKVVVDAYHGSVNFYVIDPQDPLITTWQKLFPGLLQPFQAMPVSLQSHIRYPLDLFRFQSQSLLTYHMSDPQVFYNREDQWRVPTEIYGGQPQVVEPYYLIMKLPSAEAEEFILLYPFTPVRRNNLIAWLAARSDGANYGKRLLYQFPKQELVYGPEQVEALINQDPVISQQISLWNRQGSKAIQGNLLIIPIEQSLLYVEPIYLEAEETSVPILARVIVVYENQISMAKTLEQALAGIFQLPTSGSGNNDTVVRPIEDAVPPSTPLPAVD